MPRGFSRTDRVSKAIQVEVAHLIQQEMKDPRLGTVTITGVDVSGDMSHAKIYIIVREDKLVAEQTLQVLNKAAGFLRQNLRKSIQLRSLPQLHFHYDESAEYGQRIDELLKNI